MLCGQDDIKRSVWIQVTRSSFGEWYACLVSNDAEELTDDIEVQFS